MTASIEGDRLDEDGLLCDFHDVERVLKGIAGRFHNGNLNDTAPFDVVNPTAENVAREIGEALARESSLPQGVRVASVEVTEAVGCSAIWLA